LHVCNNQAIEISREKKKKETPEENDFPYELLLEERKKKGEC